MDRERRILLILDLDETLVHAAAAVVEANEASGAGIYGGVEGASPGTGPV
jgi:hypothetical protein